MITNSLDNSDIEFYWGEWNSHGKKEGFGIRLSSNGNFYFGTFKNDKMEGLGLYAFADKTNEINLSDIKNEKIIFIARTLFSKENNSSKNSGNSGSSKIEFYKSFTSNNKNKTPFYLSITANNHNHNNSDTISSSNPKSINNNNNNNNNISIEEKLREYYIKNENEENDYFLYIGEFKNDKFQGFGDIYDKNQIYYSGIFTDNKITGDGKFKLRNQKKF